jgi:uncharacterized protein YecA (UPF0149 family)
MEDLTKKTVGMIGGEQFYTKMGDIMDKTIDIEFEKQVAELMVESTYDIANGSEIVEVEIDEDFVDDISDDMKDRISTLYESNPYIEYCKIMQGLEDFEYSHLTRAQREADIQPIRNSKTDPKQGRNNPCLCGSGKKYKQCCLSPSS